MQKFLIFIQSDKFYLHIRKIHSLVEMNISYLSLMKLIEKLKGIGRNRAERVTILSCLSRADLV
ncbi:hypothetical protein XCR1_980051 [Xenorhabdus cabanillasii JM26]|uniref:Uncharacterized protein n=1 Tax=Xenorhabdus cabanillasii JM26 TaxID=1427517 RepID=W1JCF6_9GAMM|nr:hypothetical protein XCR1_980051 [Xenorhabdus cabanillasii JM26]